MALATITLEVPHEGGQGALGIFQKGVPMIAEKNKGVNLDTVAERAKRPGKPALDDLGDALTWQHEKHLVLAPVCDEVILVLEVHAISGHDKLLGAKGMLLLAVWCKRLPSIFD